MKKILVITVSALCTPLIALAAVECLTVSTLGDATIETLGSPCGNGCEPTLQSVLSSAGYGFNVISSQQQYQRWTSESSHTVTVTFHPIAKYSGLDFVFGYYLNGDFSTFVPVYKTANIAGYDSVPLFSSGPFTRSISMPVGTSLAFGIKDYWGDNTYYGSDASENAVNSGYDQFLAYRIGNDDYVVAFEDIIAGTSDYDYNDIVVRISMACTPTCSVSFGTNPIGQGQSTTVSWTSSYASSFSINTIGSVSANTSGSTSVAPSSSTDYTGTVTGSGGSATCKAANGSPQGTLNVVCTPVTAYSCSSNNIVRTVTASNCSQTVTNPYASCTSPGFCSTGSSVCLFPPPSFSAFGDEYSGHLEAKPQILPKGTSAVLYWSVANVSSCTVTGANEDAWTASSSGTNGKTTSAINQQTAYSLHCDGLDGSDVDESITINVLPVFIEN